MRRIAVIAAILFALTGCGGVAAPSPRASSAPSATAGSGGMGPGYCHEAFFEPLAPLSGDRIVRVPATPRTPLTLGLRMLPPKREFVEVRVDVLPIGRHVHDDPSFPQGEEAHVRRFTATPAQLTSRTVAFEFDGRDDAGRTLPAGSYEVGFFVRTRSDDPACTASNQSLGVKYGQLGTVDWTPA